MHVQISNQNPEHETAVLERTPSSLSHEEHQFLEPQPVEQTLPIALKKGTRECTKRLVYPLAHYVSFKRFSPSHMSFLTNLNEISIPSALSEALSKEEWREAMKIEMDALEKNGT